MSARQATAQKSTSRDISVSRVTFHLDSRSGEINSVTVPSPERVAAAGVSQNSVSEKSEWQGPGLHPQPRALSPVCPWAGRKLRRLTSSAQPLQLKADPVRGCVYFCLPATRPHRAQFFPLVGEYDAALTRKWFSMGCLERVASTAWSGPRCRPARP